MRLFYNIGNVASSQVRESFADRERRLNNAAYQFMNREPQKVWVEQITRNYGVEALTEIILRFLTSLKILDNVFEFASKNRMPPAETAVLSTSLLSRILELQSQG